MHKVWINEYTIKKSALYAVSNLNTCVFCHCVVLSLWYEVTVSGNAT